MLEFLYSCLIIFALCGVPAIYYSWSLRNDELRNRPSAVKRRVDEAFDDATRQMRDHYKRHGSGW